MAEPTWGGEGHALSFGLVSSFTRTLHHLEIRKETFSWDRCVGQEALGQENGEQGYLGQMRVRITQKDTRIVEFSNVTCYCQGHSTVGEGQMVTVEGQRVEGGSHEGGEGRRTLVEDEDAVAVQDRVEPVGNGLPVRRRYRPGAKKRDKTGTRTEDQGKKWQWVTNTPAACSPQMRGG